MSEKTKSIYKKMSDITNELGFVSKNLSVQVTKTQTYKAVSEVDILEAVKPLEHKYGVYSYPVETNVIQQEFVTTTTQYGEKLNYFIRLERVYRFVNIEKPDEFIEIKSYGDGVDSGDKATGKAMTYADKYALMKAYKISTGDDPDKEASQEYKKQTKKTEVTKKEPVSSKKPRLISNIQVHKIMEYYFGKEDMLQNFIKKQFGADELLQLTEEQAQAFLDTLDQSKAKKS